MDKTPFAISLAPGSSTADKTGTWRTERATYVTSMPPCSNGCPAGEDVRGWLKHAETEESYEDAWRQIMIANPFPAVMGRICYHPCETACNRGVLDESVGINSVERFLGDEAIRQGWQLPKPAPTGQRVLVVGSGPSGLSAAYQLALLGHSVTVKEAASEPGGMMHYGIPSYRLPRAVLDAEIDRILTLGVEIELDSPVDDLAALMQAEHYDAAFVAVGAQIGKRAYIPAGSTSHVLDAVSLLHSVADEQPPLVGRRVAIYGGGNTAIDAARSAKRLGAAEAVVVYRRTRNRMPASDSEVHEAEEEGIAFRWLSTIDHVDADEVTLERMELDADGFPQPTGTFETLTADSVVLALGQDTDLSLLDGMHDVDVTDGVVRVDEIGMTGRSGVFAGGDMVPGERSATVAIGHGRRAARAVDTWLAGQVAEPQASGPLADFASLNTWYFEDAPRTHRSRLEAVRRSSTFDEVVVGLDAETAQYESRRCMSCGSCFSCDNCFAMCPDNAIVQLGMPGEPYAIDLDYCKGCGLCATECPSGAIAMVPEEI
ncbi:NAD(P)-binding protein [Aeromicrobium stalagmiti]|uniref:NAD(P)-binding protein n=1 Tax=Aeromicrobium stalagmiti TaxID=2738988 RepID=UPI0015683F0D|nr:NAD(P)-binding protein [Aeromicrobium stalagmiti]NRQ49960.1 NAD(P)-binding protein [Aeromicrobium stalagmiti]